MTKTLRSSVNVCDTYTFSGTVTRETFKINHQLNCGDKCAVAKNMLGNPLGSLGLGGTTINVMSRNILGMRSIFRNNYLDIVLVEKIQVSLKMSR